MSWLTTHEVWSVEMQDTSAASAPLKFPPSMRPLTASAIHCGLQFSSTYEGTDHLRRAVSWLWWPGEVAKCECIYGNEELCGSWLVICSRRLPNNSKKHFRVFLGSNLLWANIWSQQKLSISVVELCFEVRLEALLLCLLKESCQLCH